MDLSTQSRIEPPQITIKKRHNFSDTPNDFCFCSNTPETTDHFILSCPLYVNPRATLINIVDTILASNNIVTPIDDNLTKLLLYGNPSLSDNDNKTILSATLDFITNSYRFS